MGKRLIIKGADFSVNAVETVPLPTQIYSKTGNVSEFETTELKLLSENELTEWTILFKGNSLENESNHFLLFCNYTNTAGRGMGVTTNENGELMLNSYIGSSSSSHQIYSDQTPKRFAIKRSNDNITFISSTNFTTFEIPRYSEYYMTVGGCQSGGAAHNCTAENIDLQIYDAVIDDVSFWFE